jgi:putative ubiquitin-RnfH superfamily antitoxin RatB of RatAB toxin-antitoxin module
VTDNIRIQVQPHGLLSAAVEEPGTWIELTLPQGADLAGAMEALSAISPLFDARACLGIVDGKTVALDRVLEDGDRIELYHLFSGG